LRVAHITLGLDVGGQEKLLVEFARHADPRRFELGFISLSGRGRLAVDLEACGWPVIALNEPPGLRPHIVLKLAQLFRHWRTDVVHTHDDKPLLYASLAAQLARTPRLLHTKHYGQVPQITRRQNFLGKLAARLTHGFVCVSEQSARIAVACGVPARQVLTIWNGIDLNRFAYAGPQQHGPAVLVARLSPEKDVDTLLRAAALVAQADPAFRLEIAGEGVCLPALLERTAELGMAEYVRFLGEVRDVPALLARASLFVLSSQTEGISLTLLEAMARGLPVVATRVGGNPEVVADGTTGLLVLPGDPTALASALLQIRRAPDRAHQFGLAGRRRVEEHFDVRHMVAKYEYLYCQSEVGDL